MLTERNLWLGATTAAILILLLIIVVDAHDQRRLHTGADLRVMVSIDGGQTWMLEETRFGPATRDCQLPTPPAIDRSAAASMYSDARQEDDRPVPR